MKDGFSFCGTDIETIGLSYAPELEDTYVYKPAATRIHEETYDGHDGGYFYGSSKEPKEFVLRCYFEEKEIDRGVMARIEHLFREGNSGRLVFHRRPWCYYYATVTNLDTTGITNYMNGFVKVTMKAYYPFARADIMYATRQNKDYYRIMENTAMFENEAMVPPTVFCQNEPITEAKSFVLANPGTEYAHVGIEIAGDVGRGVTITNHTTKQTCKFVAMSESEFDGELNFVYLDGLNGKSIAVKDGFSSLSFLYHDEGYIQLAPSFPAKRNIFVTTQNGNVITINKLYDRNRGETKDTAEAELKGKYLWLNNGWHEITAVGTEDETEEFNAANGSYEHRLFLKDRVPDGLSETSMICGMNLITIEPVSEMKLTRLKFIYKPTFS